MLVVTVHYNTLDVDISKLNEAILGLGVGELHDDVNSNDGRTCIGVLIAVRQEVTTYELGEFVFGDVEGDLGTRKVSICFLYFISMEVVG